MIKWKQAIKTGRINGKSLLKMVNGILSMILNTEKMYRVFIVPQSSWLNEKSDKNRVKWYFFFFQCIKQSSRIDVMNVKKKIINRNEYDFQFQWYCTQVQWSISINNWLLWKTTIKPNLVTTYRQQNSKRTAFFRYNYTFLLLLLVYARHLMNTDFEN